MEYTNKIEIKKMVNYYSKKLKKARIQFYLKTHQKDDEIKEVYAELKKKKNLECFNFVQKSNNKFVDDIKYDDDIKMYYVLKNNKKVFFPKTFTRAKVQKYYNSIMLEQDKNSPHLYITESLRNRIINSDNDICVECGAAEAMFTIELLDYYKEFYLIEPDLNWVAALKETFKNDKKVHIINKYVSNKDSETNVTLDNLLKNKYDRISMIKMDIEGYETLALEGSNELLENAKNLIMLVCCYHKEDDERKIKAKLSDSFNIIHRKGYIIFKYDDNLKKPYIRRCVLECNKLM